MSLPETKEHLEKLNNYVDQVVQLMREKDTLDEDVANVKAIVKEELEYPTKDFMNLVKARYDASKLNQEIEVRQTALAEEEILKQKAS